MDVRFINPFITATHNVMDTMVRLRLIAGKPYLRTDPQANRLFKIAVVLHISGTTSGITALLLPESVALDMVAGLTESRPPALNDDAVDALAEIGNMISGNAKRDLGDGLSLSVPQVVKPLAIAYPPGIPVIALPFDTACGRFVLEIAINAAAPSRRLAAAG